MSECLCPYNECILCDATLVAGFSREQACQVKEMTSKISFGPKEMLFHQGDPSARLFVLRNGQAKVSSMLGDGREQILRIAVSGQLLGFESINHDTYSYSAEALTSVEACVIRQKDMLRVVAENPQVCGRIIRMLNEELEQAEEMIRDLGLKNANERVATFLLSLVSAQNDPQEALPLNLTRQEIAEVLGLTTSTVSRVMARLQRESIIIAPRGSVQVLAPDRLRSKAEPSRYPTTAG